MTNKELEVYKDKYDFVRKLNDAVSGNIPNVKKVEYRAFASDKWQILQEFVVITFEGGAISVLPVGATSNSGILRTVGEHVDGGYYELVELYTNLLENPDWREINFEAE